MCGSMRVMNTKVEEKEGESVVRSDLDSQCIRGEFRLVVVVVMLRLFYFYFVLCNFFVF